MAGMCNPTKVILFLDAFGDDGWDPQLLAVLGAAVLVNALFFWAMSSHAAVSHVVPPFAACITEHFNPTSQKSLRELIQYGPSCAANRLLDWKLFVGSGLFGIGWGLSGMCPGPVLVSFPSAVISQRGIVLPAIMFGMFIFDSLISN